MIEPKEVSCLILAGGAGSRVGGRDKGLIQWRNTPLVSLVAERISPQTGKIWVSCNRNILAYQKLGFDTIADLSKDYRGPLAGIERARDAIATQYLAVVACDMPLIPSDLVSRLLRPFEKPDNEAPAITFAFDGERQQYLCAVLHRQCLDDVSAYLNSGQRAVKHWYSRHPHTVVDFSDQTDAFRNFNDLDNFPAK